MLNTKNKTLIFILIFILISLSYVEKSFSLSSNTDNFEKKILIINSYHRGFKWTDDTVNSFIDTIKESDPESKFSLYIEYLDWKKYPTQMNLNNMYSSLKYKYSNIPIDLIVTTDDKALELAMKTRQDFFSEIPIVFMGISEGNYEKLAIEDTNITGVIENLDLKPTIEIAKLAKPGFNKLYTIHDFTESGISMNKEIVKTVKEIDENINCISFPPMNINDLVASVKELPDDSVLLLTTFYRDSEGLTVENIEFSELISANSNVPVVSLYDFYMGEGVLGGAMLQGSVQGKLAAQQSIKVLNLQDQSKRISVINPKSNIMVDYRQLVRNKISPDKLPKDTIILNKPLSFRESNPESFFLISMIIFLLILLVLILAYNSRRLLKAKKQLQNQNQELKILYEQIYSSEEELKQIVYFDALTGLPNRIALKNDIELFTESFKNESAALIIMDIDNFKYINDTLGHHFGDELLIKIGNVFLNLSPENIRVYRIGGDEFAFWIRDTNDKVESIAYDIMDCVVEPVYINETRIQTTISMGIAIYPFAGADVEQLLKNADIAMYEAKHQGKERFIFFDDVMNHKMIEKTRIEYNLQFALQNDEFKLYYQPQYQTKTNKITGFEALIRWNNEELGSVSPSDFIKIAEESQKIVAIGKWVFRNACDFAARLIASGHKDIKISINISIVQLIQDDFIDFILQTIKSKKLNYNVIELEITESVLIRSVQEAYIKLEALRKKGVSVSLDDFGTGYSSLSYLQNLPITTLKIDRAFVEDITKNKISENLASFIISMAHQMNLQVVAEGVETKHQLDILKKYDCDKIQGFYFSRPVPEEEALLLLEKNIIEINI